MTKFVQVAERQFRRLGLIEEHVRDTRDVAMRGDGHGRYRIVMLERSIHQDQPFGAAAHQQTCVLLHQLRLMPMMRSEVKIALLNQLIAHSAQHLGVVALAQLRHQDADGVGASVAQRAGQQAGLVVEFLCSGLDAIARGLRDRAARHVIQHYGNGRRT